MKKTILLLFLLMDLMLVSAQYGTIVYNIPAAGQTIPIPSTMLNTSFIVLGTRGAVNLASNTYTLTYSALPANGTTWRVKMDFRRLTQASSGANVTIFGVKPLQAHPDVDTFDITYSVIPDSVGTKYLYYIYNNLSDAGVFNANTVFNGDVTFNGKVVVNSRANFNDTVKLYDKSYLAPTAAISTGQTIVSGDTSGLMSWGCVPWCITGNSGIVSTTNFLGTTDTAGLNFRVNNQPSGRIDYNLGNTGFGYFALKSNTSGTGNLAFGFGSMALNTSGTSNASFGGLTANTTGDYNTGIGVSALNASTVAINNTAVGYSSLDAATTGSYNTAIGSDANVATAGTQYGIAIGYNATASSNQLAIAGIRAISLPNVTSAVRYILTDTSGTGDFIPQPYPINAQTYYTPVTGDSVSVSTSSNLIDPAGTIANFTVRLPASPYSGQLLEFSSTQIITALHWSVALNQAVTAAATLPSSMSAGGTVKIMYNSNTATWHNW